MTSGDDGYDDDGVNDDDDDYDSDDDDDDHHRHRHYCENRELKMETFSGRRRPDRQRKPGTKAAVASRQKSNIKIAVNSEGRRF